MTDASAGAQLVTPDNHIVEIKAQGWDALRKREIEGK
jgi:hypothetical protein